MFSLSSPSLVPFQPDRPLPELYDDKDVFDKIEEVVEGGLMAGHDECRMLHTLFNRIALPIMKVTCSPPYYVWDMNIEVCCPTLSWLYACMCLYACICASSLDLRWFYGLLLQCVGFIMDIEHGTDLADEQRSAVLQALYDHKRVTPILDLLRIVDPGAR